MKVEACIQLEIPEKDCDLPEQVWEVINKYRGIGLLQLCLPWPANAIPAEGCRITFNGLSYADEMTVGRAEYDYLKGAGVQIRVPVVASTVQTRKLEMFCLQHFAEEGFMLEWRTPLAQIVAELGSES